MNHIKQIFIDVINNTIGTVRKINDGSAEDGNIFEINQDMVDGIADNLAVWWNEKYNNIDITEEMAADYLDEVYPEY